jgi:hypothetical protein
MSGFGYELWKDDALAIPWVVLNGEGEIIANFNNTFEAKKWMKEHRTSNHWMADGTWDWSKEAC